MGGFDNEVIFGSGLDLSGGSPVSNKLNQDGFLYFGNSSGNPVAGLITSSDSIISFNAGPGSLDISAGTGLTDNFLQVANNLSDVASAGVSRVNLGLGSIATQNSASVSITGGSITGITDLAVADGGTGRSSATAYAVICGGTTAAGVHQSIASVGTSGQVLTSNGAGMLPTFEDASGGSVNSVSGTLNRITSTGGADPVIDIDAAYVGQSSITTLGTVTTGTWNATDIAVADGGTGASDASTARTNLGLVIGTNVQAWDQGLQDISALAVTDGNFIVGNGANWVAESGSTARTSLGLGTAAVENYEEGTWTPTIIGSGTAGTGTYSIQVGRYNLVGNRVYFSGYAVWSAHTGTGSIFFGGLPYTSVNVTNANSVVSVWAANLTFAASAFLQGFIPANFTLAQIQYTSSGNTSTAVPIDTAASLMIAGSYEI